MGPIVPPDIAGATEAALRARGARLTLKGEFQFHCLVHEDTSPSAYYDPARGIWHCFGCEAKGGWKRLAQLLGVLPATSRTPDKAAGARTVPYNIRDPSGELIAQHVRTDLPKGEKRFHWRRNGRNSLGGLPTSDLPLYGSELLAARPGEPVILVEGEKARDALAERTGLLVVATVTGASGTPSDAVLACLRGRDVSPWPDNDDGGRAHMARVAGGLARVGCRSVRWISPSGLPLGGDAVDWLATAGHSQLSAAECSRAVLALTTDPPQTQLIRAADERSTHDGISAADLLAIDIPELVQVVGGIVTEGLTLIAGKPKTGKSLTVPL